MSKWHYDRKKPGANELRSVGNVSVPDNIVELVIDSLKSPTKNKGVKRIHSGDPALDIKNETISKRSAFMRQVGYNNNHFFFEFNNSDYDSLTKTLKEKFNIAYDHSCTVIVPPGQCMPAHGDTFGYLQRYMKEDNPDVLYNLSDNAKRYVVFLTDWSWGQSFGAGNTIKIQWREGEIYEWDHRLIHWCSNSGLDPLVFFEISGLSFDR